MRCIFCAPSIDENATSRSRNAKRNPSFLEHRGAVRFDANDSLVAGAVFTQHEAIVSLVHSTTPDAYRSIRESGSLDGAISEDARYDGLELRPGFTLPDASLKLRRDNADIATCEPVAKESLPSEFGAPKALGKEPQQALAATHIVQKESIRASEASVSVTAESSTANNEGEGISVKTERSPAPSSLDSGSAISPLTFAYTMARFRTPASCPLSMYPKHLPSGSPVKLLCLPPLMFADPAWTLFYIASTPTSWGGGFQTVYVQQVYFSICISNI